MSVTYTAVLPVPQRTVLFLTDLLADERRRRGTRSGRRVLTPFTQAVLVLRWYLDGTRVEQLALDNAIGLSTAYNYLNEGIDVLARQAPGLPGALSAAKAAGHEYVMIDGTLIRTDRVRIPGPTEGVDLWWSGKHHCHGGNIQVVTAPDGWPIWTSDVRPGREHDTSAMRKHAEIRPSLRDWTADERAVLGDLGYEGEADIITVATKRPAGGELSTEDRGRNKARNAKRAVGERGNSLFKTTYKALRRVSLCPWRIGAIVAASLVLLHVTGNRTT